MKRRSSVITVVLFGVLFISGFFIAHAAVDYNEEKGTIISDLEQQIQARETEIRDLQQQAQQYRLDIQQTQNQQASLQRDIAIITSRIRALEIDIAVTEAQISSTTLQIAQITGDIANKENEMDVVTNRMAAIIRTLYKQDSESLLEMTLRHNALSEALSNYDYLEQLSDALGGELAELRVLKVALEEQKLAAQERQENLGVLNTQLGSQHRIVAGQRNEQQYILQETKGREASYQNLLSEVEAQQQEIQRNIFELEDQLRLTLDPSSIPTARPGVLAWPQGGILTQRYGSTDDTGFKNSVYTFHNGIDIASGFGTPITAARDGIVKAVGDNGRYAYGKWVTIEHDNGLSTLYAHLSGWNVTIGQTVREGDTIGFEGTTGFVTGSHLHFTAYVSHTLNFLDRWFGLLPLGATVNPLDYL